MPETLDDRTATYILETRRPFEDLRQVASQLAGLLVLAAAGAKRAVPDHPMVNAARDVLARAADEIRSARPDARCREHHGHLLQAAAAIDEALRATTTHLRGDRLGQVDAVLVPLKAGYGQLQAAADRLPGFELVALGQGCCGIAHSGPLGPPAEQRVPTGQVTT